MKQIKTVFKFEFLTYAKKKSFLILTLILVLAVAVTMSWGRISEMLNDTSPPETEDVTGEDATQAPDGNSEGTEEIIIALLDESGGQAGNAAYYNAVYTNTGTVFEDVSISRAELEEKVKAQEYDEAIILTGPLSYIRIAGFIGMYDAFSAIFDSHLRYNFQFVSLASKGLAPDEIQNLLNAGVSSETQLISSGKDQSQSFFYTYILIFLLYFAIMLYGQFVSASVATEKSTRAMELLVTSTKPRNLMFGKVLGTGFAGLTQLVLILGTAIGFYLLNKSYHLDNIVFQSIFTMPASMIFYTLLFFILGFFIYAFLYASTASLVSRMEELSTAVLPVTFLFIISFFITMFSMGFGSVDNILMKVASYIPLTSPMAMFARIAMGDVAAYEIIISVTILIASTIGTGFLAAKIYRMGVLMYGTPPNIKNIVKILKSK